MKEKLLTLAVALLAATGAWAQEFTFDNLKYTVTDAATHTVELTGYETAPTGALTIPATVTNESTEYSVTSIGSSAFSRCSQLTAVTIPEGVATIGNSAFEYCSALTEVNIPASVTSIGSRVFYYCSALTAIHVAEGNTAYSSDGGVLFNKDKTTLIQYPNGKTETSYIIPVSVTSIGEEAFYECPALTQVTIPEGVTQIGDYAFKICKALTTVNIPKSVISIGTNVFQLCDALTAIHVDGGNTAFCSDGGILFNKDKTTLIRYPIGKTETTYTVPASVTKIGDCGFYKCENLTQITLPDGLTTIEAYAFAYCSSLTKVTLGNGVATIGSGVFWSAALSELTVTATEPPTVSKYTFDGVSRTIPVYVPAESLEAYQSAEVWNEFTNLQAISTTGVQTPAMPESIRMQGGTLHNPQGLHLTLYDMQGRQVYSGTAATVSQPAGVYVVRCKGASGKVVF